MIDRRYLPLLLVCLLFGSAGIGSIATGSESSNRRLAPDSYHPNHHNHQQLQKKINELNQKIKQLEKQLAELRETMDETESRDKKTSSGELNWKQRVYPPGDKHGALSSSPVVAPDGTILVTGQDDNRYLYAFKPMGQLHWERRDLTGRVTIGKNGTVYARTVSQGTVGAMDPDTQKIRWETKTPARGLSIASDGFLYTNEPKGKIKRLYPEDGALAWRFASTVSGEKFGKGISLDREDNAYFSGRSRLGKGHRYLYSLGPDGRLRWKFRYRGESRSVPAIGSDGTVYIVINFGGGLSNTNGTLVAFSSDGEEKWRFKTGNKLTHMNDATYRNHSHPVIGPEGNIYIGSSNGNLYSLTPSGELRWKRNLEAPVKSTPAVGDAGVVYVGNEAGELWAISLDGEKQWSFETEGRIHGSVNLGPGGDAYFTSWDGYLYAVGTTSSGLADSSWPRHRGNARQSGLAGNIKK